MQIDFTHRQSAHCESGVTANLISHHCNEISEAMAFGLGSGLFFAYLPFIKLNDLPMTTFRAATGAILNRTMKNLGITLQRQKFGNPHEAMDELDRVLESGSPVGLQTGAWFLPYFPPAYRFHFNMHNLVVFGKEGNDYLISDPVFPEAVRCDRDNLMKARYTKGTLAPKGRMYYLTGFPERLDLAPAIRKGIRKVCKEMLKTPLPIIGVRGMRFLARRMVNWPAKFGDKKAIQCLGQLVRMQEEIGTGGAGFRFIYAAFLQEAATILEEPRLKGCADELTSIGDRWRDFAVVAARNCKGRAGEHDSFEQMTEIIYDCADREEKLYHELLEIVA